MDASLLQKAFEAAPLSTTAAIAYGLEHSPRFTVSALNGLLFAAATEYHSQFEDRLFAEKLQALMAACGPWNHGPNTASQSRKALEQLPATTQGVTLLDPYYYDHTMTYSDDSYREGSTQLFTYGYRLRPCGVFALNFDPQREDGSKLVESVICVAYLRGSDLWGRPLLFNAIWQEGLPLGASCAFEIPRWGILRRAADVAGCNHVLELMKLQCEMAPDWSCSPSAAPTLRDETGGMSRWCDRLILPSARGRSSQWCS